MIYRSKKIPLNFHWLLLAVVHQIFYQKKKKKQHLKKAKSETNYLFPSSGGGSKPFSVKGQITISGFLGHEVSVTTNQVSRCTTKAARDNR